MAEPGPKKDLIWLRQASSFWASRIILTANNFRIFDHIESGYKTGRTLAKRISADLRATEIILNSLVAIGILEKNKSVFRNSPVSSRYLVSTSKEYQGDILRHYSALWENWSGLDAVLKTGRPQRRTHDHEAFILGMHNLAGLRSAEFIAALDLTGVKRILDLGGGPGTYSMALARENREVAIMDFPETLKIAARLIRAAGLDKRIRRLPGDFMRDDIGSGYDMILVSQILHAYDEKSCMMLLRKCFRALNKGGRVVVQEFPLDETRTLPVQGALFAVNMLVNTAGGRTYTPMEMKGWLRKASFKKIKIIFLEETVLVEGTK